MSRRLPDCAYCGARLWGAQVRLSYGDLPGAPEVGWHADTSGVDRRKGGPLPCADADPIFDALMTRRDGGLSRTDPIEGHLRTIHTRGASRVSGRKAWTERMRGERPASL